MRLLILVCGLFALLVGQILANEQQMSRPARIETLELPGLNAGCHICEWRPKLNQKPAAEQCGNDELGVAQIGLFECGFSEDCERICHFLRCGTR